MGEVDAYSLFFENSPQPLYIVSKKTMKVLAVNEAAEHLYGYSKEEFLGMKLSQIKAPEEWPAFVEHFKKDDLKLLDRRISRHVLKSGEIRTMEITAKNIVWQGEEARFVMAFDVTERLRAENELKGSEERLRVAISEAPYPVMIHAEGAEVIAVSRSWIEGTGYDLHDLRDLHSWTSVAFGDEADSIRAGVAEIQSRRSTRHQREYRIRCKDGSLRTWDIITVPAGQLSDGRKAAISSGYDLTEREALSESLNLKSAALDAVSNDIAIKDQEGIISWVTSCLKSVRQPDSSLDPTSAAKLDLPQLEEIKSTIFNGRVWTGELLSESTEGSQSVYEVSITPVVGKNGSPNHFIVIRKDITQRRKAADFIEARLMLLEKSRGLSVKEALTLAVDKACELCRSTIGFYHIVEQNLERLSIQAWSSMTTSYFCTMEPERQHIATSPSSILADCLRTKRPIIHNNSVDLPSADALPKGHALITRELIVPVLRDQKVVALMGLGNKPSDYDDDDVELATYFADIAWEIAERRKSEELLHLQSAALQAADNAIIITDRNGLIEWSNPAFARLTGYSEEESLGRTPGELVKSGVQDDAVYQEMWQTIKSNGVWSGDVVNRRKDGRLYIEEQTITPIIGRSGEIEHFIGIKEDATQLRRSKTLLQARLNLTELVKVQGTDAVLKSAVENAGFLTFSPFGCFRILDKGPLEASTSSFNRNHGKYCTAPKNEDEFLEETSQLSEACAASQLPQIQNGTCEDSQCGLTHVRRLAVPVIRGDETVAVLSVSGGAADYTEIDIETVSYLAEIAYETIRQHMTENVHIRQSALLEQLYDAVLAWKLDGRIVYWNKGAERLYGYTSQEAIGQSVHKLLRTEFSRYSSEHATALAIQDRWEGELINISKSGASHLVESGMTLTSDVDEQLVLEVNRDISATRAAEEQLLKLNGELEERVLARTAELSVAKAEADKANSAKSEFLSRMSHELRTPLNSILGFSQILQLHHPEGEIKELSDPIIKAGSHLLELINEILDIARIEAGGLKMDIGPCLAKSPLDDALDLINPIASSRNITIDMPFGRPQVWINADSRRLVQVILNVLSNAVKYNSPEGKIEIRWSVEDGLFKLRIKDSGAGISAKDAPKLFEPFARFGDTFVEGTGLGLPLSQRLIQSMNGDLYLENSGPSGSTFVIVVPTVAESMAQVPTRTQETDYVIQDIVAGKILYIEDDLGNIQLLDHLIALFPEITLIPAMQGGLGLQIAQLHRPDLIILDAHLPDMKGDEVLRELKLHDDTKDIPVVILTADATRASHEAFVKAGAADFVTKPINVEDLMKLISSTLGGKMP